MFSLSAKILHRNPKLLVLNTLLYSAISLLIFAYFYTPTLNVVLSDAYRIESTRILSNVLIPIALLIYFVTLYLNDTSSAKKSLKKSLDSLPTNKNKKNLIYLITNLIPSIYSILISHVFGFIYLIIYHSVLKTDEVGFISVDLFRIILSVILPLLLSVISSVYDIYKRYRDELKIRYDYIALILFISATFLLIFSSKNDVVAVIFYVIMIILVPYAVLQLYSYIQLIRGNTKTNKKDYSALLFRRIVNRSFIVYLFLSFVILIVGISNVVYSYNEHKTLLKYKTFDYEINIKSEEDALNTLQDEQGIRYNFISDSINIRIIDDTIPLYFTDLTMINEFFSIKEGENLLINEENLIVLPSYFMNKYSLNDGEKTIIYIDGVYRYLKVRFVDEDTNFICFAYKISGLENTKKSVLINVFDRTYNINSLKTKIENINSQSYNFSQKYDRLITTKVSSMYIILTAIILIVVVLYFYLRRDYYDKLKPTLNELYKIPVRNFLVKRMIYHDDFVVLSISTVIFILIEFLIISFYNPTEYSLYFIFYKNIKFQELLLYSVIIYLFFNIIFFIEYLTFNSGGELYEK